MKLPQESQSGLFDNLNKRDFPYSILLVEDNPQQLDYLTRVLENGGYHVIKTGEASTALKILQTASPDLILSDLNMPAMDGIEFCKQVYLNDYCLGIPFVIISAIHDNFFKNQASDAGAIDYIFKPFTSEKLLDSLKEIFDRIDKNNLVEIIYVTDQPQTIINDEHIFRENGIIVKPVVSEDEAIEYIHSKKWDMVISNKDNGEISGFNLCNKLKTNVFKTIPFMVVSDNIASNIFAEGMKIGITDFWNTTLTVYEMISKIKSIMHKKNQENYYPHGIYAKLDDLDAIGAAQKMFIKKQTGIMSLSNSYMYGHIHFNNGNITDAWTDGYHGVEAFYILMSMGRGGSYTIINTSEMNTPLINEDPQKLFLYAKKLRNEIQRIWNEPVKINKTFSFKPLDREEAFIKATDGKKSFRHIINEININPYHGLLMLEKLMDTGIIITPVKEHSLMEYSNAS